ncbi:LacI family DNA-binding transcriptional regulator [Roseicyclus persicicus]|uniref:Substrate-binding domain-containing protein n=1 Tax=Roseicyclus persicicus TaxID=2650661 RepID=A0A7X6H084_9RHOB|nr:LacI family DNA-binding transcriptional regulator [Roseibacterium persicicum]NKX45636.1 substrate-binding domain-containing protein [Roseibacterium persicicum]
MKRRPTIMDVAARAGVSKSTVSLVLQGSKQVRPETRKTVEAAMAEIGYVYNRAAANLRSASVGLVGLVINDLRNPFFTEFATSLQMALAAEGYATVIANSDEDPELQAKLVGSMIEHGVAALVISPAYGEASDTFDQLARTGLPVLQVLRRMDERTDLFPFASFDYAAGSAEATRHLLDQGARHIAFVGGLPGRAITRERKSGWREVLKAEGLDQVALHGKSTRAFGMQAADTLLADHPEVDAAVCFNDLVALGLMAGFARAGRPVGQGFRVVGFDDIEEAAQSWPQLSSVSCDIAGFARDTAARLLAWMVEGQRPEPELRIPVRLVPRASSLGPAA